MAIHNLEMRPFNALLLPLSSRERELKLEEKLNVGSLLLERLGGTIQCLGISDKVKVLFFHRALPLHLRQVSLYCYLQR